MFDQNRYWRFAPGDVLKQLEETHSSLEDHIVKSRTILAAEQGKETFFCLIFGEIEESSNEELKS